MFSLKAAPVRPPISAIAGSYNATAKGHTEFGLRRWIVQSRGVRTMTCMELSDIELGLFKRTAGLMKVPVPLKYFSGMEASAWRIYFRHLPRTSISLLLAATVETLNILKPGSAFLILYFCRGAYYHAMKAFPSRMGFSCRKYGKSLLCLPAERRDARPIQGKEKKLNLLCRFNPWSVQHSQSGWPSVALQTPHILIHREWDDQTSWAFKLTLKSSTEPNASMQLPAAIEQAVSPNSTGDCNASAHVPENHGYSRNQSPQGIYVALGSNVGNRLEAIEAACKAIDEDPFMHIIQTSPLYETAPMYVENQDRFLNGVCEIETQLAPLELLDRLQALEKHLGRVKTIDKGPRSIDLDILFYKGREVRTERLTVPHALMTEREFVLRPLLDISDDTMPPLEGNLKSSLSKVRDPKTTMWPQVALGVADEVVKALDPKRTARVMSVLNTTPDSFSDGGDNLTNDVDTIREIVTAHIAAGATIIDIGGQSSRPDAPDITAEEELSRVLPAIEAIKSLPATVTSNVAISIDTYRASVAEAGIRAGAHIINDISAGTLDPAMLPTIARLGCTYIMQHMRGTPSTMQDAKNTSYPDGLIPTIASELRSRTLAAQSAGIRRWRIILDPGVGFAKTLEQNLELLRSLPVLINAPGLNGYPWLMGTSRKGFIGKITGVADAKQRTWGTAATVTAAVQGGADIVRVHDVGEMAQVVRMANAMYRF